MKFGTKEAISRNTYATGRLVASLSTAILLVSYLNVDASNLEVLGVNIPPEALNRGSLIVVVFLLLSHWIAWLGDYLSFQSWNVALSEPRSETNMHGNSRLLSQLSFTLDRLASLAEIAAKESGQDNLSANVQSLIVDVAEVRRSVWRHNSYAWFYIVGWNFLLPTILSCWASLELISGAANAK